MSQKKKKLIILLILIIISNVLIFSRSELLQLKNIKLYLNIASDKDDIYQIFYSNSQDFSEEQSQKQEYINSSDSKSIVFLFPKDNLNIRLDLGSNEGLIIIEKLYIKGIYKKEEISLKDINIIDSNNISDVIYENNEIKIISNGKDPYIVFSLKNEYLEKINNENNTLDLILKFIICFLIDILLFITIRKSQSVLQLITELSNNKQLIWNLAKNDFKTKYAGSYLGIIWAFVNPIITILIYWFVFQYGLKAGSPIEDASFIFWFMSGLTPWFFFQDALLNATNCMLEYSYLVKKVVFKISILPIIKIISALFVHLVFIIVLLLVGFVQGNKFNIINIQLIYYSFCTFFLVLGISYATSSIVLFFRDLNQLIGIFLQMGMWMTPIMWSYTRIPIKYQWIAKLNPMYYIVEGYRDTLINKVWFWDRYFQSAYFWVVSIMLFIIGSVIFKKLKPHFSDVL